MWEEEISPEEMFNRFFGGGFGGGGFGGEFEIPGYMNTANSVQAVVGCSILGHNLCST